MWTWNVPQQRREWNSMCHYQGYDPRISSAKKLCVFLLLSVAGLLPFLKFYLFILKHRSRVCSLLGDVCDVITMQIHVGSNNEAVFATTNKRKTRRRVGKEDLVSAILRGWKIMNLGSAEKTRQLYLCTSRLHPTFINKTEFFSRFKREEISRCFCLLINQFCGYTIAFTAWFMCTWGDVTWQSTRSVHRNSHFQPNMSIWYLPESTWWEMNAKQSFTFFRWK